MRVLFIGFIIILFFSCSKEKLDGDISEIFVDEWKWERSDRLSNVGLNRLEYYNSESENVTVTIKILSKGKLIIEKNGDCHRRHRILDVAEYGDFNDDVVALALELSKKNGYDEVEFSLRLNGEVDTLFTGETPDFFGLELVPEGHIYIHYFVRK